LQAKVSIEFDWKNRGIYASVDLIVGTQEAKNTIKFGSLKFHGERRATFKHLARILR